MRASSTLRECTGWQRTAPLLYRPPSWTSYTAAWLSVKSNASKRQEWANILNLVFYQSHICNQFNEIQIWLCVFCQLTYHKWWKREKSLLFYATKTITSVVCYLRAINGRSCMKVLLNAGQDEVEEQWPKELSSISKQSQADRPQQVMLAEFQ